MQAFAAASNPAASIKTPCAFVVPLYDAAEQTDNIGTQKTTDTFSVIICLDNHLDKKDGPGMSAELLLQTCKQEICAALLGWEPKSRSIINGVQYARGQHLYMDNARTYHDLRFNAMYYIRSSSVGSDVWTQIEMLIDPYFPDLTGRDIKKLFVPDNPRKGGTSDPADYHELFEILTDTAPAWIRQETELKPKEPEFIMNGDPERHGFPPDVKPRDQLDVGD